MNALGMSIAFLTDALIDEHVIRTGTYQLYEPESKTNPTSLNSMVLDSQALEHLEIVESSRGSVQGSLLEYVDHCKTPFGKRQIKRWLMAPLRDIKKINQRLDAVDDLIKHQSASDILRARFAKLPDLEKLLAKVFTYSIKQKVHAIYFEDVSL